MKGAKNIFAAALFIAYLAILLKLIVFKYPGVHFAPEYNFVPFKTILPYLTGYPNWIVARGNLLGNIVSFIPLGILISFLHRRITWKQMLAAGLFVSLGIEVLQIILHKGTFDVDDILLNTLGAILGYGVFIVVMQIVKADRIRHGWNMKKTWLIAIVAVAVVACGFAAWKLHNNTISIPQQNDTSPLNIFTDPTTGFTIKYPPLYFLKAQPVPAGEWNYRTLLTIDDNPDAPQTMSPRALPLEVDIQRQPVTFANGKIFHTIAELEQSDVPAKLIQGTSNPNGDLVTVNGIPALLFHAPRSDYTGALTDSYYFIKDDLIYEVAVNVDDPYAQKMIESISWDTPLVDEKTALAQLRADMQAVAPHFIPDDDGSAEVKYAPEEQKIRDDLVALYAARYAAVDPTTPKQSLLVEAGNGIWPHAVGKRYILLTEANAKNGIDEVLDSQTGRTTPVSSTQAVPHYLAPGKSIALYIEPQALYIYSLDQAAATLVTGSQLQGTETYDSGFRDGPGAGINPQETHTTNSITISVFDSSKSVPNPDVSGATMYRQVGQKTLSF